jgi:hypothetical protein
MSRDSSKGWWSWLVMVHLRAVSPCCDVSVCGSWASGGSSASAVGTVIVLVMMSEILIKSAVFARVHATSSCNTLRKVTNYC